MQQTETDYLIVGAGASGMAFADSLLTSTDTELLLVDQRHAPGGHWLDAYPFVRLHQPSAYYGVNSLPLGADRIDEQGINAGFYERASGAELCSYYQQVLDSCFLPSGRLRFAGCHRYLGLEDGTHRLQSVLTGKQLAVRVRRKLIDATYTEAAIPATTPPPFEVDQSATVLTPSELVHCANSGGGFTVLGAGKTAMDTCQWLLDQGVPPDDICWVRPRDGWFVERTYTQPLTLAGHMMAFQAASIEAAADARSPLDYALRLEAAGMFQRLDQNTDPVVYRGATLARGELEALRSIEQVIRGERVLGVMGSGLQLEYSRARANRDRVYINCTAAGLSGAPARPIFERDRITVQFSTIGVTPWSAAVLGQVEALDLPLAEKNALCPPLQRTGLLLGQLDILARGMPAEMKRRGVEPLDRWMSESRLNAGRAIPSHMDRPDVQQAFQRVRQRYREAVENLHRLIAAPTGSG
ncbi:MAG: NAD(P)-binding protein [Pseudomonadota bacterium]